MVPAPLKANSSAFGIKNRYRSNADESYYGDVSYNEWCRIGTLALLRYRRKQLVRRASLGGTALLKQDSNDANKVIPKKRPPSESWDSPLSTKKQAVDSSLMQEDDDVISNAPLSNLETAVMSLTAASLDGPRIPKAIPQSHESLLDLEDDGNAMDGILMDDDELTVQDVLPARVVAPKDIVANADPSPSAPTAPSPFLSFLKQWRPFGTKKPQECFGRRKKSDLEAGSISFTVKGMPPQCIALVEGVCDTSSQQNTVGNQNYFASPQYRYLSDLLDHGQLDLFPHRGSAFEIPLVTPVYPGLWMVQVLPPNAGRLDSSLPKRQSDWNGSRIRMVHQDYEHRLAPLPARSGDPDISMVRIDPVLRRMALEGHDDLPASSFIGAIGVVLFDGFGTTAESAALQGPLSECLLQELRHSLAEKMGNLSPVLQRTILGVDAFTTKRGSTLSSSDTVSGCGGVMLPVSVACRDAKAKHNHDDYHLLIFTSETVNSIVAIEIVFNGASVGHEEEHLMNIYEESKGLTQKQLDQHASKSSAVNILRLWKQDQIAHTATPLSSEKAIHGPLKPGEMACFDSVSKHPDSDAMSVAFTALESEYGNHAPAVMSPNQLASPSSFTSANCPKIKSFEDAVHNITTKVPVQEMCLDSLPGNTAIASEGVELIAREKEESHAAAMELDLSKCPSTFASAVSPTFNPAHQILCTSSSEMYVHGASLSVTCPNQLSVDSTVVLAPSVHSESPSKSMLSKPLDDSLNRITPTPYRPTELVRPLSRVSLLSAQRVLNENFMTGKHLFPEAGMKQSVPVPVVLNARDWEGAQLEVHHVYNAAPELTPPDVIVPTESEKSWTSWWSVFFGLYDQQDFPEMSREEFDEWIHNHDGEDIAVAPVCLHDALFGWTLDDFHHDDDASAPWYFHNWFIPMVTWGATVLLMWYVSTSIFETSSSMVPLPDAAYTDLSRVLLERMLFEDTGHGSVGTFSID